MTENLNIFPRKQIDGRRWKDTQHYKGHENQNYNELSPPTIKIAIIKKDKK